MHNEEAKTDSPGFAPDHAAARQRRAAYARRLARAVTEAGYDAIVWVSSLFYAAWLTSDIPGIEVRTLTFACAALVIGLLSVLCGLLTGLYRGRYQRGSFDEVFSVILAGALMLLPLLLLSVELVGRQRDALRTVVGGALIALPTIAAARYLLFTMRQRQHRRLTNAGVPVIVFGAGHTGTALIARLLNEPDAAFRPVAILDDDPDRRRLRVRGIPVLGDRTKMAQVAAATGATVLVIAIAQASGTVIRDLVARAEECGLTPKVVPTTTELISGGARIEGVRDPRISDLLGRRPIRTDVAAIADCFAGKRILVTGAGGSIGSELCRQLHRFAPAELIMLDHDESALHEIQLMLYGRALLDSDETVLADIRDPRRIREVFQRYRPQIVFHAAALKHLPLLERFPAEAVQSNVLGTQAVLEAAAAYGVETFVNISTDKAADPVCVLGYSKRVAERLTAHMAAQASGTYLSVRFGNVLGSRGSVLGALSAQVKAGGPMTVTDPEVTRYFMTVDEAVQLVLQAAAIGGTGEVLILDMGEPVRIADIARRLSAQSAQQVDIVYTGLRPGEKLVEDLLGAGEEDYRPRHPLVRHALVKALDPAALAGLALDAEEGVLRARLAECATGDGQPSVHMPSVPRQPMPDGSNRWERARLRAEGETAVRSGKGLKDLSERTGVTPVPPRYSSQRWSARSRVSCSSRSAMAWYPRSGPPAGSGTSSARLAPSRSRRPRPPAARASQSLSGSPGERGPAW